jgi:Flp pilus assembly protein CpaB
VADSVPRLGLVSRLLPQQVLRLTARCRRFTARHRLIAAVPMIAFGVAVGAGVRSHVVALDQARHSWEQRATVLTMRHAVPSGQPVEASDVIASELPVAGVAALSLSSLPGGAVALDDLSAGETLLANHLVAPGAGRLPPSSRGVSIARHDASLAVRVGDAVQVMSIEASHGGDETPPRIVAARAVVVEFTDASTLVAVSEADAPLVAQAAVLDRAVLVLLPR